MAQALNKRVQDVVVMMLDRPRHKEIVAEIRRVGASLRMISDGDIAAAIGPAITESGIDLYFGIGGSPEAVLAAAALKCLGGDMQCMMWPRDEKERAQLIADGYEDDLDRVFYADDLANGKNIIFCATGISDSALLRGSQNAGANDNHALDPDAGEEQDRPFYPRRRTICRTRPSVCVPTAASTASRPSASLDSGLRSPLDISRMVC